MAARSPSPPPPAVRRRAHFATRSAGSPPASRSSPRHPTGEPTGLIVNSLASVSLEPPLVSFSPARSSLTWSRMRRAGRFGVNVLGRQHEPFVVRAAPAGADRFAGLDWEPGRSGVPLLTRRPRPPRVRDRRRAPRRRPLDRRRASLRPRTSPREATRSSSSPANSPPCNSRSSPSARRPNTTVLSLKASPRGSPPDIRSDKGAGRCAATRASSLLGRADRRAPGGQSLSTRSGG